MFWFFFLFPPVAHAEQILLHTIALQVFENGYTHTPTLLP